MFPIVNKQILGKNIKRLDILAPAIARKVKPGQFVVVVPREHGEWLPLTVAECDSRRGTIVLIFREVGVTTRRLGVMPINDSLFSIIGPLGKPASIKEDIGTVVCVATGVGIASILPICRGFKRAGNKVIGVIGAKTKASLMLEMQMRMACHKVLIATEDGSYERRGSAINSLKEILDRDKVDLVYAIGSVGMMHSVSQLAQDRGIRTLVQVNSVISCGTGRCGSCRTKVGNKTLLSCQHGPEFDGHRVNFEQLRIRTKNLKESKQMDLKTTKEQPSIPGTLKEFFSGVLSELP